MNASAEHILLVESDPDITELIARQALQPLGYQVQVADDASAAIMQVSKNAPDLVIVDLNLIGLSGKDLLVAFNSQGLQVPAIVIAEKGQETKVIQGSYPADVVDMVPEIAKLKPAARKDLRQIIAYPELLERVGAAYLPLLKGLKFDRLAGLPYAAIPIATAISLRRKSMNWRDRRSNCFTNAASRCMSSPSPPSSEGTWTS